MPLSVSQALGPFLYHGLFQNMGYLKMTRVDAIKHSYVVIAAAIGIAGLDRIVLNYHAELEIRVVTTCEILVMFGSLNIIKQALTLNTLVTFLTLSLLLCAIGFSYALAGV